MRRTRKWAFVAQEASRLHGLGLSPREIAQHLQVNKSTVTRWMQAGKFGDRPKRQVPPSIVGMSRTRRTPGQWAKEVRENYDLDSTDDQLVTLAEEALRSSLDRTLLVPIRLNAAKTFQGLIRQLALVARHATAEPSAPVPKKPEPAPRPRIVRPPREDPRAKLMAG